MVLYSPHTPNYLYLEKSLHFNLPLQWTSTWGVRVHFYSSTLPVYVWSCPVVDLCLEQAGPLLHLHRLEDDTVDVAALVGREIGKSNQMQTIYEQIPIYMNILPYI